MRARLTQTLPPLLAVCFLGLLTFGQDPAPATPASTTPATIAPSSLPAGRPQPFTSAWSPGTLELTILDVGQGDGLALRGPDGRIILVDAGKNAHPSLDYLRAVETTVVDALVLSHPHLDHIGGAQALVERVRVNRVYDCGYLHTTSVYRRLLEAIEADSRIDYFQPRAGDILDWGPGLKVTVLHPDRANYEDINDNSIVLHVAMGAIAFVLTGDAEAVAEAAILDRFAGRLGATVLKVGHHGSTSSTTLPFLKAIAPKLAVISCGAGNSYGHPRAPILDRLREHRVETLRTDLSGWISILTDGETYHVRTGGARR